MPERYYTAQGGRVMAAAAAAAAAPAMHHARMQKSTNISTSAPDDLRSYRAETVFNAAMQLSSSGPLVALMAQYHAGEEHVGLE